MRPPYEVGVGALSVPVLLEAACSVKRPCQSLDHFKMCFLHVTISF